MKEIQVATQNLIYLIHSADIIVVVIVFGNENSADLVYRDLVARGLPGSGNKRIAFGNSYIFSFWVNTNLIHGGSRIW